MSECIRRDGSEWTLCPCANCRTDMRRKKKLARNGIRVVTDRRDAARQRIETWKRAGYSIGVMASMTGIRKGTLARHIDGTRSEISHATAARIMAADPHPGDEAGFVPRTGTVRRLRALTVMGWSMHDLAERTGLKESTLHALRDPNHAGTRPRYARAVADIYDELSMTRGDCRYAATRAIRKGWHPPLAWDDDAIDDPDAEPQGVGAQRWVLSVEDIAWWLEQEPTATAQQVGDRFGVTKDAVQACAGRAQDFDLLARLARNAELAGHNVTSRRAS